MEKLVQQKFWRIISNFKMVFPFGGIISFPCVWLKKWSNKIFQRYFQPTIIIGGMLDFAPYNLLYFTGGLYISYIFMFYIKKIIYFGGKNIIIF